MKLDNLVGHIGYAFGVLGMILVGNHLAAGWACFLITEVIWLYLGLKWKKSSIWFWCFIYAGVHVYNYSIWSVDPFEELPWMKEYTNTCVINRQGKAECLDSEGKMHLMDILNLE